jgi:hypothetical protein
MCKTGLAPKASPRTPRPFISGLGFSYSVPQLKVGKVMSTALRIGRSAALSTHQRAAHRAAGHNANPTINNLTFQNTVQNRVPGEPLFTNDLNCHC